MKRFEDIADLPYIFRGALAFNQRTVAGAIATLLDRNGLGGFLRGTPIRLTELTNVLLLLESIAMSNGMYLDGTLPPSDIERLQSELWRVRAQSGVDLDVDFLRPSAEMLVTMFRESAEAAALPGQSAQAQTLNGPPERTYFWISGFNLGSFCQPHAYAPTQLNQLLA